MSCGALHVQISPDAVADNELAAIGSGRYISETKAECGDMLRGFSAASVDMLMMQ
jgi:hypothetical protein